MLVGVSMVQGELNFKPGLFSNLMLGTDDATSQGNYRLDSPLELHGILAQVSGLDDSISSKPPL